MLANNDALMHTFQWMLLALLVIGVAIIIIWLRKIHHDHVELHKSLKNHLIYHVTETVTEPDTTEPRGDGL